MHALISPHHEEGNGSSRHTLWHMSQAQKRCWKIDNEVQSFCSNKGFWHGCWHICRWTMAVQVCMHNGFTTGTMEQMIIMSLCDIMRFSHARKGRELYKESTTKPWGCCYCQSGCSGTKHLGSLTSHRPSTLAVLVLFEEEAQPEWTLLFIYPYACIQTFLEDF